MAENPASKAQRIMVSSEHSSYSIIPGKSIGIVLKIHHQSELPDYYEIGIRGIPASWATLSEQVAQLAPMEEREITLTIQLPPPPQTQAGIFPIKVVVTSQSDPTQMAQTEISLHVAVFESQGRIGVMMESLQYSVAPGGSTFVRMILINQGLAADSFRLSVEGLPVNWLSTQTPITQLEPGGKKEINLTIQPPRSSGFKAGRNKFKLKIASQLIPEDFVEINCVLTIAAYSDFRAGMLPDRVAAGDPVQIRIENLGNVDQSYDLTWQSSENSLVFDAVQSRPQPANVQPGPAPATQLVRVSTAFPFRVPAGGVGLLDFHAQPANRAIFGGEKVYPYTLVVKPVGTAEAQAFQGQVSSRGRIPVWVIPVILAIFLGFFCLSILLTQLDGRQSANATQTAAYGNAEVMAGTQTSSADQTAAVGQTPSAEPPTAEPTTAETLTVEPTTAEPPTTEPTTAVPDTEVPSTETPVENTPVPLPLGIVAFVSDRDGNPEIYSVRASDANVNRLTNDPAVDAQPAWSPDGSRLAFKTNRDGNFEIYVMNADGSNLVNLTNNPGDDQYPTWSPDGQRIAFSSNRDGNWEIYLVKLDGSGLFNLTNNPFDDKESTWFKTARLGAASEQIVFTTNRDGNDEIYTIAPDGTNPTNLTNNPASDTFPAASGTGEAIAFVSDRDGNRDIFVMAVNGSSPTRRTNDPADDLYPSWAPDNQWIAFSSNRGDLEIFVMKVDGSNVTNVTNNPAADDYPAWK